MNNDKKKVIVRFPPSPTGPLHIGNVRTALFNYFFAKQNNGTFIVRVEDTDKMRSEKKYENDMLANLEWLGIKKDNDEIWHQSERIDIYKKYLDRLISENKAYISQETEGENKEVVRFRNPKISITFNDLIRGDVTFDTTDLGDFIIARNINDPVYHLAVVVDDFEQGITHIIRGEDHISNTPRQILIQQAINAPRPIYAHLPLILAPDRTKLSKRKHGEIVSLNYYREQGYLAESIINFLGLLGFNPGGEREIYDLNDFINIFDFEKVQKGGATVNIEKLNWFNKNYIKNTQKDIRDFNIKSFLKNLDIKNLDKLYNDNFKDKLFEIILDRINFWSEIKDMADKKEIQYFFETPVYQKELLFWKKDIGRDDCVENTKNRLEKVSNIFENANEKDFDTSESVKKLIWTFAETEGRGEVLWPLRAALSGLEKSPDPFTLCSIFGKEDALKRIANALDMLK